MSGRPPTTTGGRRPRAHARRRCLTALLIAGVAFATVTAAEADAAPPTPPASDAQPPTTVDPAGGGEVDTGGNTVLGSSPAASVQGRSVAEQYIVTVEDSADLGDVKSDLVAEGAAITNTWDGAVSGLTAKLDDAAVSALEQRPDVIAVEPDHLLHASGTQTGAPWNLDRIDQRTLPLNGTYSVAETGRGVTAYVIDSGIRPTHTEFVGRVARGAYWDFGDGTGINDCNGHGTHVAGTVGGTTWGVAKEVTIVPVKVLQCTGSTTASILIEGINWVIADHQSGAPAVVNMSIGGRPSAAVDDAVNQLIADGITVVVAAGNDSAQTCSNSPARVPSAITVAASDQNDNEASFTNHGSCNDIFAPGVGIQSASYQSDVGSLILSGTSMAAPHVTGAAALVLQRAPSATPAQVWQAISDDASRGVLSVCCGDPNALLHVGPPAPSVPPSPPVAGDGPSAASARPGQLDVFIRGFDDAVWTRHFDGTTWSGWTSLGGIVTTVPSVVSPGPGRLYLFARGADHALWTRSFDGVSWSGWSSLGGILSTGAVAASRAQGTVDVFVGGGDGAVWYKSLGATGWGGWGTLGGFITATPAAASAGPGTVGLFVRGGDNALWFQTFDGSAWSGWGTLGGVLTSAPGAASRSTGSYEVFVRGNDLALWTRSLSSGWSTLGGLLTSPAAAASAVPGTMDVFARGGDNALWAEHDGGGGFTGWYTLGGGLR
jgi:subtilisin family serine protease